MTNQQPGISDRINEHLLEERDQAVEELKKLKELLGRPVNVTIKGPEESTLVKIGEYLPQLTYMATNISSVASAIQASNGLTSALIDRLDRIADIWERTQLIDKPLPLPLGNAPGPPACKCDGKKVHAHTKGYCPVGGPVTP